MGSRLPGMISTALALAAALPAAATFHPAPPKMAFKLAGELRLEGFEYVLHSLAFSQDGKLLAVAGQDSLRVFETGSGKLKLKLKRPTQGIHYLATYAAAFGPDGSWLAAATDLGAETRGNSANPRHHRVRVFDPTDGKELAVLEGHGNYITALAAASDGRLISASADGSARLWKEKPWKPVKALTGLPWLKAAAFSSDERTLALTGANQPVTLWEPGTGKRRTAGEAADQYQALAFSPDGQYLAAAGKAVRVLSLPGGETLTTLPGWSRGWEDQSFPGADAVAFSPDSRVLAAAGCGGTGESGSPVVRFWDTATGRIIYELWPGGEHEAMVMESPDDRPKSQKVSSKHRHDVAFSPDNRTVAVLDSNKSVKLYGWSLTPKEP